MAIYRSHKNTKAFGETKRLSDWAEDPRCVVPLGTLYKRVERGWPADEAMIAPANKGGRGGWDRMENKIKLLQQEVAFLRNRLELAGIALDSVSNKGE